MAIKTIPARTVVTCDACGRDDQPHKQEGHLTLRRHALDMYGDPCANGTVEVDLCDHCLGLIGDAINRETNAIRAAVNASGAREPR
jgi:hypothetical protein